MKIDPHEYDAEGIDHRMHVLARIVGLCILAASAIAVGALVLRWWQ